MSSLEDLLLSSEYVISSTLSIIQFSIIDCWDYDAAYLFDR